MGNTSSLKSGSPEEQLTTACQFINEYQLFTNQRLSRSLLTFCAHLSWYIYSPEARSASLPEFCEPISTQISSDKHLSQWSIIVLNHEILELYQSEYLKQHQSESKEELQENIFTQLLNLDIDAIIVWKGADSDNIFDIFEGIGCIPNPIEFNDIYSNNLQSFLNHRNTLKKSDKRKNKIKRKLGLTSVTKEPTNDPIIPHNKHNNIGKTAVIQHRNDIMYELKENDKKTKTVLNTQLSEENNNEYSHDTISKHDNELFSPPLEITPFNGGINNNGNHIKNVPTISTMNLINRGDSFNSKTNTNTNITDIISIHNRQNTITPKSINVDDDFIIKSPSFDFAQSGDGHLETLQSPTAILTNTKLYNLDSVDNINSTNVIPMRKISENTPSPQPFIQKTIPPNINKLKLLNNTTTTHTKSNSIDILISPPTSPPTSAINSHKKSNLISTTTKRNNTIDRQRKLSKQRSNAVRRSISYTDDFVFPGGRSRNISIQQRQRDRYGSIDDYHLNLSNRQSDNVAIDNINGRSRGPTLTFENEYYEDENQTSSEDDHHQDNIYDFNQYLDKIVNTKQTQKEHGLHSLRYSQTITNTPLTPQPQIIEESTSQQSFTQPDKIQKEFDLIQEKICQSQLYSYDPIGIHATIYSTAKRDIYTLSHEINKHLLINNEWQEKITNQKKINIICTGHSLGGAIAESVLFRTLLQRHRNHIPSIISPFIELTHAIAFGAGSIISYPYSEISNVHVQNILNKMKEIIKQDTDDDNSKQIDIEMLDEFNTNRMTESSRLSPETRRFLMEYNKRVHVVINNFDMITRLPNVQFWRNKLIPTGLNSLILDNKQLNEGLLGFIPQSKKKQQVEKLTNWLCNHYQTHDGIFDSYSCLGNYYILIGGPTSFSAVKVIGNDIQTHNPIKRTKSGKRLSIRSQPQSPHLFANNIPSTPPGFKFKPSEEEISKFQFSINNSQTILPEQSTYLHQHHSSDTHISHISDITILDPIIFTNYENISFIPPGYEANQKGVRKIQKNKKISRKNLKPYYQNTAASIFAMSSFQARVLLSMAPEQLKEDLTRIFHDHSVQNYIRNLNPNFVFHSCHYPRTYSQYTTSRKVSLSISDTEDHMHGINPMKDYQLQQSVSVNNYNNQLINRKIIVTFKPESKSNGMLERAQSFRSDDELVDDISTTIRSRVGLGINENQRKKGRTKSKSNLSHFTDVLQAEQSKSNNIALIQETVLSKNAAELFGSKVNENIVGSGYTVNHFYYQFCSNEIINGPSEKYKNMLRNEKTFLMKSLNSTIIVKILDFSNNGKNFGDDGARLLCQVLMKNKSIRTLNISGNCITNAGAIFLGRLIDKNFSIKCLNLSNNNIEDDGAQQLADGLIHNKCLNQLIIYNNKFSSKGFMELTRIIAYNSNLRELILWEPFN